MINVIIATFIMELSNAGTACRGDSNRVWLYNILIRRELFFKVTHLRALLPSKALLVLFSTKVRELSVYRLFLASLVLGVVFLADSLIFAIQNKKRIIFFLFYAQSKHPGWSYKVQIPSQILALIQNTDTCLPRQLTIVISHQQDVTTNLQPILCFVLSNW
jgi:hypothetical protein